MLVVFRIRILSSDIRKFHYGHQIHRTNMNEHWLNCLYTRVKPALNKNLTCHLLFDIFQTFSNNRIFFRKKLSKFSITWYEDGLPWPIVRSLKQIFAGRSRPPSADVPTFSYNGLKSSTDDVHRTIFPAKVSHFGNDGSAQNPKLAWILKKIWN